MCNTNNTEYFQVNWAVKGGSGVKKLEIASGCLDRTLMKQNQQLSGHIMSQVCVYRYLAAKEGLIHFN